MTQLNPLLISDSLKQYHPKLWHNMSTFLLRGPRLGMENANPRHCGVRAPLCVVVQGTHQTVSILDGQVNCFIENPVLARSNAASPGKLCARGDTRHYILTNIGTLAAHHHRTTRVP
jgi:hypothetical protein